MARIAKRLLCWMGFPLLGFAVLSNLWIWSAAVGRMGGEVPEGSVIVLLGTNEFFRDGVTPTATYRQRITRTVEAARGGRAALVISSGTGEQAAAMAKALKSQGCLTPVELDPYGWRTLDSVLRAKAQHSGRTLVFVSQGWHCTRALWWADRLGVAAVAAPCEYGDGFDAHVSAARDVLAKPKAVIDWVLGSRPSSPLPVDQGNVPAR
ncbi:MAG: ElyC/SanA/YdcF family protein [Opitutales bacterium]